MPIKIYYYDDDDDDDDDDDYDDDKPVWPTWAVGALFRGVRRVHIKMKKKMTLGGWSMAKRCHAGQQEELILRGHTSGCGYPA